MSLFIETLCIKNGSILQLHYHQERFNCTRLHFYPSAKEIILSDMIKIPKSLHDNLIKCRIVYTHKIEKIEYEPYIIPHFTNYSFTFNNDIDYCFKYYDRTCFFSHEKKKHILSIIVKHGRLTDSPFSNIVLFDGNVYWTPLFPLLKGTKRAYLLENNIIQEKDILYTDIKQYKSLHLINAFLDKDTINIPL